MRIERTITLADGDHVIATPSYYGLQLMEDYGANDGGMMHRLPAMLAALLTDAEPLKDRRPAREWSPVEVAKLIQQGQVESLWAAVADVVASANDEVVADGDDDARPTRPPGAKKR